MRIGIEAGENDQEIVGIESGQRSQGSRAQWRAGVGQQIEQIIERIESGQIGLERSIGEYERGVALIRRCREALGKAEQRVEELTSRMQADSKPSRGAPSASGAEETPF